LITGLGGLSIKIRTQSAGQGGYPVPIFFGQGVIQMQTSVLFVGKTNIEYFKIYIVSTSDMDRREGKGGERD